MEELHIRVADPKIQAGIQEMEALIRKRYSKATFTVGIGEDPAGVYLTATIPGVDFDEAVDVYIDRLVDLQAEQGLPLYVIPITPPEAPATTAP
jgi:HSP20 family molecular chaperone IbpA